MLVDAVLCLDVVAVLVCLARQETRAAAQAPASTGAGNNQAILMST